VQPVTESGGHPPDRIENTGLDRCRRKRSHAAPGPPHLRGCGRRRPAVRQSLHDRPAAIRGPQPRDLRPRGRGQHGAFRRLLAAANRRGHKDRRRCRATRLGATRPEPSLIVRNAGEAGGEPAAEPSSNVGGEDHERRIARRIGVGRPGQGAWLAKGVLSGPARPSGASAPGTPHLGPGRRAPSRGRLSGADRGRRYRCGPGAAETGTVPQSF
jgi:hypothetical protein